MIRAGRIVPSPTAFSRTREKQPREHERNHLDFIRGLPCLITGRTDGIEAAHIRYADPRSAKPSPGMGRKPDDIFVVPLHKSKHDEQHRGNEREFWRRHGIDPIFIALALWAATGKQERAELILSNARTRGTCTE